jgi:hypothetical protein
MPGRLFEVFPGYRRFARENTEEDTRKCLSKVDQMRSYSAHTYTHLGRGGFTVNSKLNQLHWVTLYREHTTASPVKSFSRSTRLKFIYSIVNLNYFTWYVKFFIFLTITRTKFSILEFPTRLNLISIALPVFQSTLILVRRQPNLRSIQLHLSFKFTQVERNF